VILTAGYILWTVQRVFLGRSEDWKGLPDMNLREIAIGVPLVVLTIAMGVFPHSLVLSWVAPSVDQVVKGVVTAREINIRADQVPRVGLKPPASQADTRPSALAKESRAKDTNSSTDRAPKSSLRTTQPASWRKLSRDS
jgi:hypothetical protein